MNNDGKELTDTFAHDAQGLFRQPSAEEVVRLTYGKLLDLSVCTQQEVRNDFARLLNRGSSLE